MSKLQTLDESLQSLVGSMLSSVEFVMDYVQIRFSGPTLTAFTLPFLVHGERTIRWGEPSYRDSLCALIGVEVRKTSVIPKKELAIDFVDGTILKVSLEDKDYCGPEAVYFVNEDGSAWVV